MSRWATWSAGTENKGMSFSSLQQLVEQGRPVPGDPQEIVQQNGWQHKGYGYYVDGSGQTVARIMDGQLFMFDGEPNEVDKQVDSGNPTPAGSGMKPADRARSMGLQSDGRGGYVDPKSGQKVARTVNNELVFYDQRPGGGAVSDGAGGQALAQDTPSWQDPVTGLVVTPPAKPESAQEIAMVPDPVPAQAPHGFNDFVQSAKLKAYASQKVQQEIEQDLTQKEQELAAKYQSETPGMSELFSLLDGAANRAEQSGDPIKMDAATRLKQRLEEDADTFEYLFQNIPGLNPKEVVSNVIKYERNQAINAAMGEDAPLEEKEAAGYSLMGKRGGGLRYFIPRLRQNVEPQQQELLGDGAVSQILPDGAKSHIIDSDGGKVEFELIDDGPVDENFFNDGEGGASALDQNMDIEAFKRNHFTPGNKIEINWDVKEGVGKGEGAAIDAMRTWQNTILPNLPVGSVITAFPDIGNQEQLTRLYGALGFGRYEDDTDLKGVVTIGEDGQKFMQPLGDRPQMDRVREAYLPLVYQEINSEYQVFVEEMLFS